MVAKEAKRAKGKNCKKAERGKDSRLNKQWWFHLEIAIALNSR